MTVHPRSVTSPFTLLPAHPHLFELRRVAALTLVLFCVTVFGFHRATKHEEIRETYVWFDLDGVSTAFTIVSRCQHDLTCTKPQTSLWPAHPCHCARAGLDVCACVRVFLMLPVMCVIVSFSPLQSRDRNPPLLQLQFVLMTAFFSTSINHN